MFLKYQTSGTRKATGRSITKHTCKDWKGASQNRDFPFHTQTEVPWVAVIAFCVFDLVENNWYNSKSATIVTHVDRSIWARVEFLRILCRQGAIVLWKLLSQSLVWNVWRIWMTRVFVDILERLLHNIFSDAACGRGFVVGCHGSLCGVTS